MQNISIEVTTKKFATDGYVIFKNVIPIDLINKVLKELENLKKTNKKYISQNTHRVYSFKNTLDDNGFLVNSIQSPSRHVMLGKLRKNIIEILTHENLFMAISSLSPGNSQYICWQDMLFDKSTGTIDHRDVYYLDTWPVGKMNAAWIAMEDIDKDCGTFHVWKGSHLSYDPNEIKSTAGKDVIQATEKLIKDKKLKKTSAIINKGDVLIWNSLTLHGSDNPLRKGLSRKSLTAHYYPVGSYRSDGKNRKDLINDISKMKSYGSKNIYFANNGSNSNLISFNKNILLRYCKDFLRKGLEPINGMNRSFYK